MQEDFIDQQRGGDANGDDQNDAGVTGQLSKLLREINLLEKELEDMLRGDHGIGSSVVMDYRKGYPQPQGVTGFDGELYDRRRKILESKREKCKAIENWLMQLRIRQHAAFSKCTTLMD